VWQPQTAHGETIGSGTYLVKATCGTRSVAAKLVWER
jgi:hypothetical protein